MKADLVAGVEDMQKGIEDVLKCHAAHSKTGVTSSHEQEVATGVKKAFGHSKR